MPAVHEFAQEATVLGPDDFFGIDQQTAPGVYTTKKARASLARPMIVRRTFSLTRVGATLADDTELKATLGVGPTFLIEFNIVFDVSVSSVSKASFNWTRPAGTYQRSQKIIQSVIPGNFPTFLEVGYTSGVSPDYVSPHFQGFLIYEGHWLFTPSAAGVFAFKWAAVAGAACALQAGSWLRFSQV